MNNQNIGVNPALIFKQPKPKVFLMSEAQETMLAGLERRKEESKTIEKIDSSTLYAGSPMYYYCRMCGLLAATLPESHIEPAPRHCEPCKVMVNQGYDSGAKRFG